MFNVINPLVLLRHFKTRQISSSEQLGPEIFRKLPRSFQAIFRTIFLTWSTLYEQSYSPSSTSWSVPLPSSPLAEKFNTPSDFTSTGYTAWILPTAKPDPNKDLGIFGLHVEVLKFLLRIVNSLANVYWSLVKAQGNQMNEIEIDNQDSFGETVSTLTEVSVNTLTTLVSSILGCRTIFELPICGVCLLKKICISRKSFSGSQKQSPAFKQRQHPYEPLLSQKDCRPMCAFRTVRRYLALLAIS